MGRSILSAIFWIFVLRCAIESPQDFLHPRDADTLWHLFVLRFAPLYSQSASQNAIESHWLSSSHTASVGLKHRQVGGVCSPLRYRKSTGLSSSSALFYPLPHLYNLNIRIVSCYFFIVVNQPV